MFYKFYSNDLKIYLPRLSVAFDTEDIQYHVLKVTQEEQKHEKSVKHISTSLSIIITAEYNPLKPYD